MALFLTLALILPAPASALREPQTSEKSGAILSGLEEALSGEAAGREPEEEGPPDQAFDRQLAQLLRQGAPEDRARAASLVAEKYAGYAAQVAEDWYARARYFSEVIARAPFPYELEREDAAQEAALALRDLTRRWQQEPPKSDTLGTPIYVRVKQSVTDQLSKRWGASRGLIEQALVALHNAIREPPGGAADQIRLSDEQVRAHLRGNEAVRTLAKRLLKEEPVSWDSFEPLPASETGTDVRMDQEELRANLRPILDRFPPRRREMLKLSYQIMESHLYSTAEVADMMGISERQVKKVRRKALRALRLPHVHIERVDPAELSERLAERGPELLTARERQILRWTFGLPNEDREYTLEQIGEVLHASKERVRQTVARVIRALQMPDEPPLPDEPPWLLPAMPEQELEEAARRHLWSFPRREREILRLRFRMGGVNPYSRFQVADILRADPTGVAVTETHALRLLGFVGGHNAQGVDPQALKELLQERGEELLSARQRQVLRWRAGLPAEQALSEQEIGQIFKMSRSNVRGVIEDVARLSGRRLQDQVNRLEPFEGQWLGRAVEERAWEQPASASFRPRASVRKEVPIRRGPLSEEEEEALLAWVNGLAPMERRILPELLDGLGADGRTAPSAEAIAQKLGLRASWIGPNRDRLVRKLRVAFTLGGFDRFGSFKRVVGRLIFLAGETRLERLFRRANLDALLEVSRGDSDMVREALIQLFPGEFKEKELRELIGQHFRELFTQVRPGAPRRISARQVLQPVHRLVAYLRGAREAAEAERRRLVLKRLIRDLYFAVIEQDEEEGTTRGITTLTREIEREGDPFWKGLLQETLDFYSGGTSFQVRGFREEVAPDVVEPMLLVQRLMTYEAVQSLQGPDRGALLASEPRTMKTIPAVLAAYNVRAPPGEPPLRRVLYTTSNQAKYEVAEELRRRTNEELGLTVVVVDAEDVEHGDRQAQITRAAGLPGNVVLIANYESVRDYPREIGAFRPDAHVIDEIENLRHGDETIRAPIIFGIPARYRIGVSARLVVNDPADTLEPLLWTRPAAFAPPQEGRARILAMSPDELFAELEPVVSRWRRKIVMPDVPEPVEIPVRVPYSPQQERVIRRMRANLLEWKQNEARPEIASDGVIWFDLVRLEQRAGVDLGLVLPDPEGVLTPDLSPKIQRLNRIIDDQREQQGKVLVLVEDTEAIDRLEAYYRQRLGSAGAAAGVHGGRSLQQRVQAIRRFRGEPEPVVLIGTYSSLSASLNLSPLPGMPFHNSVLVGLHESWMRVDDKERLIRIGLTYRVKAYRFLSVFASSEENTPDLILHERHGGQQELRVRVLDGRPVLDESSQSQLAELARLVSTRPAAEPAAASLASGLEETKPNADTATEQELARHLVSLDLSKLAKASIPDEATRRRMAAAIGNMRRPQNGGPFGDVGSFKSRLYGKVSGVKNAVWDEIGNHLSFGKETQERRFNRRPVVKWATLLIAGATAAWVATKILTPVPPSRTVLVFGYHALPADYDGILEQLRLSEGDVLYIGEAGPADLASTLDIAPELGPLLSIQALDELIRTLQIQGEAALGRNRLGAALAELHRRVVEQSERNLERFRNNPRILDDPEQRKRSSDWRVLKHLAENRQIQVAYERPPLLAFLYGLRSELAFDGAIVSLVRDRNEGQYQRLLLESYRFKERQSELRERDFAQLIREQRLQWPGSTLIVLMGLDHRQRMERLVEGAESPTAEETFLRPLDRFLLVRREAILRDEEITLPLSIQRVLRLHLPGFALENLLIQVGEVQQRRSEEVVGELYSAIDALSEAEAGDLIATLQTRGRNFERLVQTGRWGWFRLVAMYTVAWMNSRSRMPPTLRSILYPGIRRLTLEEADAQLREELRAGLEEKRETAEALRDLIRNVGAILETERLRGAGQLKPRTEQIQSKELFTEHHVTYRPATQGRLKVIGDLHGDLEALERALAQAGYDPHRNAGLSPEQRVHLLFVGDYADVGTSSVEVAARVLLLKATDPQHVVLLGGNHDRDRPTHESANVQMHPIRWFFKELEEILGPAEGDKLYGEFHRLMSDLPVLAVFPNGVVIGHAEGPHVGDPLPGYPEKFRARYNPEQGLLNLANPLIVDQLGWNPVRRPPDGQPEAEEDQIVDGAKHPRIDPSTMQPGYWIGRKSHFGFLNSIGGKVFLRGHDRLGPPDQVLFDGTFLTVITTDHRSPDHGYDPKEKIIGRYAEFDLSKTYDTIDPDEVVRYLLWPPTGHGLASYYTDLFRKAPGVIPYPIKREGSTYIFRTVDHLVEFRVAGDRLEVRTNGVEGYLLQLDEGTSSSAAGGRQLQFAYRGPPVLEKVSRQKLEFTVHVGVQLWSGTDPAIPLVGSVNYQPLRRTVQFRMVPGAIPPGSPNRSDRLEIPVQPFLQELPVPAGLRVTFHLRESRVAPGPAAEMSAPAVQATRLPDELGGTLALFREIATARDWKKLEEVMLGPDAAQNDQVRVLQSAAFTVLAAPGPGRLEDEALLRIATLMIVRNRGTAQLPEGLLLMIWRGLRPVLEELIAGPVPSGLLKDALAGKEPALLNLATVGAVAAFELANWAHLPSQPGFQLQFRPILNLAAQALQGDLPGRFWNARPFFPPPPSGDVGQVLRAVIPPVRLFNDHRERVEATVRTHLGNLTEPDEDLRWSAASGLGTLGPDAWEAVPALALALEDSAADVRRATARALGSVGYQAAPAAERLQALAQSDPDPKVQEAARWALSILQSRPAPAEQTLLIDVTLPSQQVSFAEGSLANTLQMAVHDSLLGAVQPHFQGVLPPESWRVISRDPEEAARQLADFTASDQVVRMTVLDKGILSAAQARGVLPQSHAPTFLVDEESARQLTPLVAAFLMSLGVPAEGLYLLELRHDDLSGGTRVAIYA